MLKLLLISCLLIGSSQAFWRQCHEAAQYPTPSRVESPFCTATGCSVTRGQRLTGQVWFTPARAHAVLEVFNRALYQGAWIDLPVDAPHDNACNDLHRDGVQVTCPTVPNAEHRWNLDVLVPEIPMQLLGSVVEFLVVDVSALEVVLCFEVDADIN